LCCAVLLTRWLKDQSERLKASSRFSEFWPKAVGMLWGVVAKADVERRSKANSAVASCIGDGAFLTERTLPRKAHY